MPDVQQDFRDRFIKAQQRSRFKTNRKLAAASGVSPAMIDSIVNGKFAKSRHGPCILSVHRAAEAMGVTLDDLIPPVRRPDVRGFLRKHPGVHKPDARIALLDEFEPYCDVYRKPENGITNLKRLGPKSLLSQASGLSDPALVQLEYQGWSARRRSRIFRRQQRAWNQVKLAEIDNFYERSQTLEKSYQVSFWLAACRYMDKDGEPVLVVFCEPEAEHLSGLGE